MNRLLPRFTQSLTPKRDEDDVESCCSSYQLLLFLSSSSSLSLLSSSSLLSWAPLLSLLSSFVVVSFGEIVVVVGVADGVVIDCGLCCTHMLVHTRETTFRIFLEASAGSNISPQAAVFACYLRCCLSY